MKKDFGIILDLFPPLSWNEQDIITSLEIAEDADKETGTGWGFLPEDMAYLAKIIAYYKRKPPSEWGEDFEIDTDINFDDPMEDGRFIINMRFPEDMEPPSGLR
jgi:hypothetical protein